MNTVDYQLEILQAYKEGKEIEYIPKKNLKDLYNWKTIKYIPNSIGFPHVFNFNENAYRIKDKIRYRGYTSVEEFYKDLQKHGTMLKIKEKSRFLTIIEVERGKTSPLLVSVAFHIPSEVVGIVRHTPEELLDRFTWPDGSPCGVIEQ